MNTAIATKQGSKELIILQTYTLLSRKVLHNSTRSARKIVNRQVNINGMKELTRTY